MKKVLFTATVDSHILQFHIPFLKLFKEKGYEVHVATNGNAEIPYCDKKHIVSFEKSPIKINNLKAIVQLKKIIKQEKFDIIHCHTPMGGAVTRIAARKLRKRGTRVIYTAHGFHFFKGAPIKNWLIFYTVEKYLAKFTDTLITINKEDYELAKKKFSKRCKDIQYVPGVGIDEEKFNFEMSEEEKIELRKSIGLKKDDFVMIYPAEISKRKRQEWLINSLCNTLKTHKDMHLLLPGTDLLNGKCQEIVSKLELNKQVHFLGYRKDIPKLLKISNLAVSSASQEGLPVNIMEAMYVGLPIVASNCRGNRDLVEENCIVELNDKDKFKDLILKLRTDKNFYKTVSEENKKHIQGYILRDIIDVMEKIYFRKKKILHLLASNIYSGAENVACTIINNLSDEFDMVYCSPNGEIAEILKEKGIKYIPLNKLSISEVKKVIKQYNPDIIHAHDFKASFCCSIIKKNRMLIEHFHNNPLWMKKINVKTLIFLFAGMRANKILTVSKSIQEEYIFSNLIIKKIECIGNPVSRNNVLRNINDFNVRKKYDICCVARITLQKNPMRFLQIISEIKKSIPNINAVWVGEGELRSQMEQAIEKMNLNKNIELVGFQKNPYKYMMKSKIFVLTSDWEGYGLVAFEALTLGLPCIVSNVGGLPNIVDTNCGIICNSISDFIQGIIKCLQNKENYNYKSKYAIEKSIELENIFEYIERINQIYGDIYEDK